MPTVIITTAEGQNAEDEREDGLLEFRSKLCITRFIKGFFNMLVDIHVQMYMSNSIKYHHEARSRTRLNKLLLNVTPHDD